MKQIIILIGLKGSGKTYIGSLAQKKLGIKFFRVEDVWLSLRSERLTDKYMLEGFGKVEKEIERLLEKSDRIIIESTGTTDYFTGFLSGLKSKHDVKLVKVHASPELCFSRVKSRDSSVHVPVSDDIMEKINKEALKVNLKYDLIIENEYSSDNEILATIQKIL